MTTEPGSADIRIVVGDYDSAWGSRFRVEEGILRDVLGPMAICIDHIGSIAVPDLAAKDILDVQVAVAEPADLDEPSYPVAARARRVGVRPCGWQRRSAQALLLSPSAGQAVGELHVRRHGCVSQQQAGARGRPA